MTAEEAFNETKRRIEGIYEMQDRWNNSVAVEGLKEDLEYYKCVLAALAPKSKKEMLELINDLTNSRAETEKEMMERKAFEEFMRKYKARKGGVPY